MTLTLADEIDISRGDMIAGGPEPRRRESIEATMVWFDGKPLDPAGEYLIKHTSQIVPVRVEAVEYRVDINTLHSESSDIARDERSGRRQHLLRRGRCSSIHIGRIAGPARSS